MLKKNKREDCNQISYKVTSTKQNKMQNTYPMNSESTPERSGVPMKCPQTDEN